MIPAPLPATEAARLSALRSYRVLDTDPEPGFDDLTELAAHIAGTPIALVSLVDAERQWFKSRHGLGATETPRDVAFCAHAILTPEPLVVPDATLDERFHDNPLVRGAPHVRSYAGTPLVNPEGHALGTLCVIDHVPRTFPPAVLEALRKLGRQAVSQLELRRARDAALAAAAAKAEFLANVSHEIRTPLNGVIGTTQLLLDTELSAEQREYAATARDCGEHLLAVVNDVLDLSKLEAGGVELEHVDFDLHELVRRALAMVLGQARAKGLALDLRWRVDGHARRHGDPMRVRQVLLNLLGNALKFTDRGRVTIDVEGSAEHARIAVTDTGIGIPRAALGRLFDRFVQADPTTTRRFGGTGLGLAISRRLVDLMRGEIGVDSTPGIGSTFWFRLPLPIATATHVAAVADADAPRGCRGLRVLVVEDNPVNRLVTSRLLAKLGCEVVLADGGADAVARWNAAEFDVVLMDCRMPDVDGFEATRRIRASGPRGRAVPIVALTASALDEDRERCSAAGMSGFLSKPVDRAKLERALVDATARAHVASSSAA